MIIIKILIYKILLIKINKYHNKKTNFKNLLSQQIKKVTANHLKLINTEKYLLLNLKILIVIKNPIIKEVYL